MKKKISLLISVVLVLTMLLSACNTQDKQGENTKDTVQTTEGQEKDTVLKGRYAEQEVDISEKIRKVFDFLDGDDGTVKMIIENEPGSFCLYESTDEGATWQKKEGFSSELLPENYGAASACFGPDESIIVSAGEMTVNEFSQNQIVGEYKYYELKETGDEVQANELHLELPEPEEAFIKVGYGLRDMMASDSGYIYGSVGAMAGGEADYEAYKLICADKNSGNIVWSRDIGFSEFILVGDVIYLKNWKSSRSTASSQNNSVSILKAESGEESGEYELPQGSPFIFDYMDFDTDNGKIYYCNQSGIYGTDEEHTLTEQLVDGNICSISGVSAFEYSITNFYVINESVFILFLGNGDNLKMLRYEYDPDLATLLEKELTIYSLKENGIIRKMIYDFQLENPDVYVKYEIGMKDDSVKTVSDAIGILNTEIMAGNGPDVLMLNGLPWESYEEKGILTNLSGELDSFYKEDKVFQNIFSVYRQDDSQYVVPLAFRIPLLVGSEETVGNVETIKDLVETAKGLAETFKNPNGALLERGESNLLRYITSVCWQSIQNEDGKIEEDRLRDVLKCVKELNDTAQEIFEKNGWIVNFGRVANSSDEFSADSYLDAGSIVSGMAMLELGYLSSISDYVDIYNYGVAYREVSERVFSSLLAGVNGETDNKDLAKEFISFILSEEGQESLFDGGLETYLPINKDAFRTMTEKPEEEEMEKKRAHFAIFDITFQWPEESWFQELEELIGGLTTPAMEDSIVIDAVMEYGLPYINGEKDLDTAVSELKQTLELYLAE